MRLELTVQIYKLCPEFNDVTSETNITILKKW